VSFIAFSNRALLHQFIFHPYTVKHGKEWHRFLTHGLIHANYTHLLFNLITFYFFGPLVEEGFVILFGRTSGRVYYLALYIGALIISSLPSYFKHKTNVYYRSLGASGAVSAVLFSAILLNPTSGIDIFLIPIAIPAWLFGILYLAYSAYMARRGVDNIGHDAHFVGALFGLLFTIALKPVLFEHFVNTLLTAIGG